MGGVVVCDVLNLHKNAIVAHLYAVQTHEKTFNSFGHTRCLSHLLPVFLSAHSMRKQHTSLFLLNSHRNQNHSVCATRRSHPYIQFRVQNICVSGNTGGPQWVTDWVRGRPTHHHATPAAYPSTLNLLGNFPDPPLTRTKCPPTSVSKSMNS